MDGKATLTYPQTITWSNGDAFYGHVLLILTLPVGWTQAFKKAAHRIPTRYKVPIINGQYDPNAGFWRTDHIVPPNCKYSAFFYDATNRLIDIGPNLFDVTTNVYTLAPPTLTAPNAPLVPDQPETVPSAPVVTTVGPAIVALSGAKDGVNTVFTVPVTGTTVLVTWNGLFLEEGVHYLRSGNTVTMQGGNIPGPGDQLIAIVW